MELPRCPNELHRGSRVTRAGWYGKAPQLRQRWWCAPTNGAPPHRFTPQLTRQTHKGAAPNGYCLECSTAVEPWEGQAGARTYLFAAREVGDALARVAQGSSYRAAAAAARDGAERVKQAKPRPKQPAPPGARRRRKKKRAERVARDDGQLVANWVDVFTSMVCDGLLPTRWPDVLVIDSKAFVRGGLGGRRFTNEEDERTPVGRPHPRAHLPRRRPRPPPAPPRRPEVLLLAARVAARATAH